jgi:type IV secretion system protein VirB11
MNKSTPQLKQQLLDELIKGNILNNVEKVYQVLNSPESSKNLQKQWSEIKSWYLEMTKIIYIQNNNKCIERTIDPSGVIFDKCSGTWVRSNIKLSSFEVDFICRFLQSTYDQDINFKAPFVSFTGKHQKLEYRFSLQILKRRPEVKIKVFIRMNRFNIFPVQDYLISEKVEQKINVKNIIISGATGSGKTSLLKSLLFKCGKDDHFVVIEDLNEIGSITHNTTQLCSSDIGQDMNMLLTNALRMSPERIILGEIRASEITTFLLALNSGHSGSMATIHANSAPETIYRMCELLQIFGNFGVNSFSQLMKVITRNIDYVLYLENKKVKEIIKVVGSSEKGTPYFENVELD